MNSQQLAQLSAGPSMLAQALGRGPSFLPQQQQSTLRQNLSTIGQSLLKFPGQPAAAAPAPAAIPSVGGTFTPSFAGPAAATPGLAAIGAPLAGLAAAIGGEWLGRDAGRRDSDPGAHFLDYLSGATKYQDAEYFANKLFGKGNPLGKLASSHENFLSGDFGNALRDTGDFVTAPFQFLKGLF